MLKLLLVATLFAAAFATISTKDKWKSEYEMAEMIAHVLRKSKIAGAEKHKVDTCLNNYNKGPVNIYINWNPETVEKIRQELFKEYLEEEAKDTSVESGESLERELRMKEMITEQQSNTTCKCFASMLACSVSTFTDALLPNLPYEKTNVAFGHGDTWYYINGAETRRSNWPAFFKKVSEFMNVTETQMFTIMVKMIRELGYEKEHIPKLSVVDPSEKLSDVLMHTKTNISDNLKWGMFQHIFGKPVPFTTQRPASFNNPSYQMVVTAGEMDTSKLGQVDSIVDFMGHFANSTTHYTTENVYIAAPPYSMYYLVPSTRYRMCQRNGGISEITQSYSKLKQPPPLTHRITSRSIF